MTEKFVPNLAFYEDCHALAEHAVRISGSREKAIHTLAEAMRALLYESGWKSWDISNCRIREIMESVNVVVPSGPSAGSSAGSKSEK